uniref:Carboxyvinyl-carboxyphosphonate phosphorylmutase n=1 Tax=Mucochytrium quahogii TaxID=96639 RepID=A0A7S2W8X5_9STRA|mmetsp:Transcript_16230/g.26469  ORF Transcript_16230/g.26469 Transcript_16230/m.26469 type:complete len:314 (+) Transcript_16230:309-1250(+)
MGRNGSAALRAMLKNKELIVTPCCHDGFSARLIQQAGFKAAFASGYCIAATRGFPDTGLISGGEMIDSMNVICESVSHGFPVIGDGDTGYGNAMNVKRTVRRYSRAGVAAIMLEDQVDPKQCGHTEGKQVISREQSVLKIKAACDARDELRKDRGLNESSELDDILILARTDARGPLGLDEAIERCQAFRRAGADITFLEAPQSLEELERYCKEVPGPKMANMLVKGKTPILSADQLHDMGFSIVAYPFDLLGSFLQAANTTLSALKDTSKIPEPPSEEAIQRLWDVTGFNQYQVEQREYGCNGQKKVSGESI